MKAAFTFAGAYGCTISEAGPTCVAVTDDPAKGERISAAMVDAFVSAGQLQVNSARVVKLDQAGAHSIST
jgi:homoserine kinase